ncbi:hypothetical protein T484DRAFT_1905995 [Baffinella frigidus]|nr:hypothetical protein T484DRAFT_1905995 [Cryptophyta sp. CCMP2293]
MPDEPAGRRPAGVEMEGYGVLGAVEQRGRWRRVATTAVSAVAITCLALTWVGDSTSGAHSSSLARAATLSWAPWGPGVLAEKALGASSEEPGGAVKQQASELAWPGAVREAARRVHARQEDLDAFVRVRPGHAERGVHGVSVGSVEREMTRERERTRDSSSVEGVQKEAAAAYARSLQTATQE